VAELITTRGVSQSLDKSALDDTCDLLEEELSRVNRSLHGFNPGSTFQAAVEVLATKTGEVEEEESTFSSEIAVETQRLEWLELKVSPFLRLNVRN
jgi:gamma-glutamylcysteine synthetase